VGEGGVASATAQSERGIGGEIGFRIEWLLAYRHGITSILLDLADLEYTI
jgi:hypothetical protein